MITDDGQIVDLHPEDDPQMLSLRLCEQLCEKAVGFRLGLQTPEHGAMQIFVDAAFAEASVQRRPSTDFLQALNSIIFQLFQTPEQDDAEKEKAKAEEVKTAGNIGPTGEKEVSAVEPGTPPSLSVVGQSYLNALLMHAEKSDTWTWAYVLSEL